MAEVSLEKDQQKLKTFPIFNQCNDEKKEKNSNNSLQKSNFGENKSVQVCLEDIPEADLIYLPAGGLWKAIAEKRRVALEQALSENEHLHMLKETFTKENDKYQNMLDEANSFVEVFKDLLQDGNDTGIDVADVPDES